MDFILKIFKEIKDYKKVVWFSIILILIVIFFYPIIDTNFLYYNRISNRIDILDKVSKLNKEEISKNVKLVDEYNSILDEIFEKKNNYLNNILVF